MAAALFCKVVVLLFALGGVFRRTTSVTSYSLPRHCLLSDDIALLPQSSIRRLYFCLVIFVVREKMGGRILVLMHIVRE